MPISLLDSSAFLALNGARENILSPHSNCTTHLTLIEYLRGEFDRRLFCFDENNAVFLLCEENGERLGEIRVKKGVAKAHSRLASALLIIVDFVEHLDAQTIAAAERVDLLVGERDGRFEAGGGRNHFAKNHEIKRFAVFELIGNVLQQALVLDVVAAIHGAGERCDYK